MQDVHDAKASGNREAINERLRPDVRVMTRCVPCTLVYEAISNCEDLHIHAHAEVVSRAGMSLLLLTR